MQKIQLNADVINVRVISEYPLLVSGLKQIYNDKSPFQITSDADLELSLANDAAFACEIIILECFEYDPSTKRKVADLRYSGHEGKILLFLYRIDEKSQIKEMADEGVAGYLLRTCNNKQLTNALHALSNDGMYFPNWDSVSGIALSKNTPRQVGSQKTTLAQLEARLNEAQKLSDREEIVLRKMALGLSMKQIASDIYLSSKTIDTYRSRAMKKLGLVDRHAVVKFAIESGWLDRSNIE